MISYDGWDREYQSNKQEYLELFDKFMSQLNYENNEKFEKQFAEKVGRKYAISVANATDALHFSLLSHNIGLGDEVLVTDFSWISSASCVSMARATPVFCDIDLDSYHMNINSIKRMYSPKVKALIYPHLFGNMTDTSEIQNFCREKGIIFIEDAAQSLGSSLNGINAGTIGDCSVYSFNSNKVVAGINGGGMLLTDNEDVANRVKLMRKHGKDQDFKELGFNSRMYVLNAQIIELRLKNSEKTQKIRQQIASTYNNAFANFPIVTQKMSEGLNHNYHKYVIRFTNINTRNHIKNLLKASVHYDLQLCKNSMYNSLLHRKDNCVVSNMVSNTILSLPIHAWLNAEEINTIINIIENNIA
jgi:dTDP-4-amino-4,6-dideoxygalactose transaminase